MLLLLSSFFHFFQAKQRETIEEKQFLCFIGFLFFSFGIAKLFWFIAEYNAPGIYVNYEFLVDFNSESDFSQYNFFHRLGFIAYTFTSIFSSYFLEGLYKRSKYSITILNTLMVSILIIIPFEISELVFILSLFVNMGLTLVLTYKITKKSRYELRALASLIVFGMIFIVFGYIIGNESVKSYNLLPLFISPLLTIGGICIALSPMLLNTENYKSVRNYWITFGIFLGITSWAIVIIMIINSGLTDFILVFLGANILMTFILFSLISIIRTKKNIKRPEKSDVLEVLLRPKRISEEEVSISKEKKICLVCKSKVGGIIFMCKSCGAFYCKKCSESLINIENMCWNCEAPIDESKPVKKQEEDVSHKKDDKGKMKLNKAIKPIKNDSK